MDAAREQWWIGLRSAEESHYDYPARTSRTTKASIAWDSKPRCMPRTRCMEFDQVSGEMNAALEDAQRQHPGANVEDPFIRGYQRGREHYQQMCDEDQSGVDRSAGFGT